MSPETINRKKKLMILVPLLMAVGLSLFLLRERNSVRLVLAGDIMMDRYFRIRAEYESFGGEPYGFVIPRPSSLLDKADFVVANLEGPVMSGPSESAGSRYGSPENFRLKMEPEALRFLKSRGITTLCVGNNHAADYGKAGLEETGRHLADFGFSSFGRTGGEGFPEYLILEKGNCDVGFVSYNRFSTRAEESAMAALELASDMSDIQIVYAHWGEEYASVPDQSQRDLARRFLLAGADLVVGSHPHVIQAGETAEEGRVYYSLGNFIFDQYFSEETRKGILLSVVAGKRGIRRIKVREVTLHPSGETSF